MAVVPNVPPLSPAGKKKLRKMRARLVNNLADWHGDQFDHAIREIHRLEDKIICE